MTSDFIQASIRRIYIGTAVFGVAGTVAMLLWKGWHFGAGFAVGAALSALNFHWLKGGVDALTARFQSRAAGRAQAVKFLLRYALIGGAGYVIFRTSVVSLNGFLTGLFVFVAAILVEMVYELILGSSNA